MDEAMSMQPQDSPLPTQPSAPTMQNSAVDGDLHADDVTINHHHTEPVRDTLGHTFWVSSGLIVVAILLAMFGVLSDDWAVEEKSETIESFGTEITTKMESEIGLDDFSATVCINGDCTTHTDDLGGAYENCTSDAVDMELNSSKTEEVCGDLGDMARAGFTGMIFITVGICVMLATLIATFLATRGTILPYTQYYSFGGAALTFVGVVAWKIMLPEGDTSLGYSAWMTIASIVLATVAGGYAIYYGGSVQSPLLISRTPGQGVRALTAESEAREFVLRENAMGTKSTSLVEQGKVLRLVYAKLDDEDVVTEDHFIVQKAALTGFIHYRYDWLDNGKYMWWSMAAFGIISLFISPAIGSSLLLIGALLSLAQLFDPELLSFETNAGRHRLLLYRQDSNRELMNFSMDEIDSKMQQLLSGEQLDGESVELKAAEIEKNRAAQIKAEQEAATALELAKAVAATPPVIAPTPTLVAIPGIEPMQQPVAEAKAESIIVEAEVVIPPPPTPTEVQSLPPPPPTPTEVQSLPPPPQVQLPPQPLPPPPQVQMLPVQPLPLIDTPLPPPPPLWGD